ncbi:MAG TPA: hypothetical protein VM782_02495 [Stellaceae bacterium]|nr:hypothetical protein [Stellaceae bacterium]
MPDCYVQYGCGFCVGEGWLNFDASPTLRIERIPLIGKLISAALSGNDERFPDAVRYGDICKGPLVAPGTAAGIYASHVLEHLSLADFRVALVNTYAMWAPGGAFRLIVPDLLARTQCYLGSTEASAAEDFMRATTLGKEARKSGVSGLLREWLGNSAHQWMWDEIGFTRIRRCEHGDSGIATFDVIEEASRFYDPVLDIRECAMEAWKP